MKNINKKLINNLNKEIIISNNSTSTTGLNNLFNRSINIIKYILDNLKITNFQEEIIPEFDIDNLSIYLLKNYRIISNNSKLEEFQNNLKNNKLNKNNIKLFFEENGTDLQELVYTLLFINKNHDNKIKKIIKYLSENIVSSFIDIKIQSFILKKLKFKISFEASINNIKYNFKFFLKKNYKLDKKKILILILKTFYPAILFSCDNVNIDINYYLTNFKKKLPKKKKFLSPENINSGVTIKKNSRVNEIIIYRKEEYEKISIHEIIHVLNIDDSLFNQNNDEFENKIKCNFNIAKTNKLNFVECYTECMAVILNCIVDSILTGNNINILLNNEIKFNILQCSKIIKFNNMNIDNFICEDCCFESNNEWIEKTSVISYFFLKLGSLIRYEIYINKYMFDKNINISEYYNFIQKNLINIKFIKNYSISNKLNRTLRMTINQFNWNNLFKYVNNTNL